MGNFPLSLPCPFDHAAPDGYLLRLCHIHGASGSRLSIKPHVRLDERPNFDLSDWMVTPLTRLSFHLTSRLHSVFRICFFSMLFQLLVLGTTSASQVRYPPYSGSDNQRLGLPCSTINVVCGGLWRSMQYIVTVAPSALLNVGWHIRALEDFKRPRETVPDLVS